VHASIASVGARDAVPASRSDVAVRDALLRLGHEALASYDLPTFLVIASKAIASALDVPFVGILDEVGDSIVLRTGYGWAKGSTGATLPAFASGYTTIAYQDITREAPALAAATLLHAHAVHGFVAVPLADGGRSSGRLIAATREGRRFDEAQVSLLRSAAALVVATIARIERDARRRRMLVTL